MKIECAKIRPANTPNKENCLTRTGNFLSFSALPQQSCGVCNCRLQNFPTAFWDRWFPKAFRHQTKGVGMIFNPKPKNEKSIRSKMQNLRIYRKGLLHTLEATVAFLMVISFLVFVMPSINTAGSKTGNIRSQIYDSLSEMDKSGTLRNLAFGENLSGIKSELNRTLNIPLKFTVGMSKSNISHGTANPEESGVPYYINYTANKSALDSATLSLNYLNATEPSVYLNGVLIKQHGGDYSGNDDVVDVLSGTQDGENSIKLETSNNATISYSLMLVESLELEALEENTDVISIGYILSGNETTFSPKEIRVYVWD